MMEQAVKDDSDRIKKHCQRRQERKLAGRRCHDPRTNEKILSYTAQSLMNSEPFEHERSIDPELIISPDQMKTFDEGHSPGSRMIRKWRDGFLGAGEPLQGNEWHVAEAARSGLMKVGETECRKKEDLIRINKEFNRIKGKSRDKIAMYCIRLYTRAVFVHRVVNEALRNDDESKSETLGPFCYLLTQYLYASTTPAYHENVFRGCQLESSMIEKYRQIIGKRPVNWLGFTSTTKSITVANQFDCNVLFNIDLSRFKDRFQFGRPVDISHLSEMTQEDEVLLPAGFRFIVVKVEDDMMDANKTIIYICGIPH